jgi:hypothetical protein
MSNEVALFEGAENLPAHLRGGELSETAKALAGGSTGGDGLKRVSIKGSVFRMMLGSKEVAQNEDRGMNMIIVKSAPGYARTYYEGTYKEGVVTNPACWSDDGNAPSKNVESPQSSLCANCPQNAKGSGQGGGRACRYSARLAVVLENDPKGDVYGMQIPATSIFGDVDSEKYNSLQQYVKKLAGFGYDVTNIVTEFRFDTKSPVPKLMFRAVRAVTEQEFELVKQKAASTDAKAHTGDRSFAKKEDEDDGFEKPIEQQKAELKAAKSEDDAAEPVKVVKKKAEPVKAEKADLAAVLDEWADD